MEFLSKVVGHQLAKKIAIKNSEKDASEEKKKEKKKFILFDLIKNPETFMLVAFVDGDEIHIRIKKKEDLGSENND